MTIDTRKESCRWCKRPVQAMVRKGTGFCSAICRDSYAETCDSCRLGDRFCPGQDAHCQAGEHCTFTVEVCALEWRSGENPDGHPKTCEHCEAKL